MNIIDILRLEYIRAKDYSHKPEYWRSRLIEAIQKQLSYETDPQTRRKLQNELNRI